MLHLMFQIYSNVFMNKCTSHENKQFTYFIWTDVPSYTISKELSIIFMVTFTLELYLNLIIHVSAKDWAQVLRKLKIL